MSVITILIFMPLFLILERRRLNRIKRMIRPEGLLKISVSAAVLRYMLLSFVAAFIMLALAGPRWGEGGVSYSYSGKDIIFAVDISNSMLARDASPDRISLARRIPGFIVRNIPVGRVGVVFFGGEAYMHSPLTSDTMAALSLFEDAFSLMSSQPGTNIEKALRISARGFTDIVEDAPSERFIILITDGEELQGNALSTLPVLKRKGIRIISVGIGTADGATIPVYSGRNIIGDYRQNDELIITRLNADLLNTLAEETGGDYFFSSGQIQDITGLFTLLEGDLEPLPGRGGRPERYYYFALAALSVMVLESLLTALSSRSL